MLDAEAIYLGPGEMRGPGADCGCSVAVFAALRGAEDGLRLARVHAAQDAPGGVATIIDGLCKKDPVSPSKGRSGRSEAVCENILSASELWKRCAFVAAIQVLDMVTLDLREPWACRPRHDGDEQKQRARGRRT